MQPLNCHQSSILSNTILSLKPFGLTAGVSKQLLQTITASVLSKRPDALLIFWSISLSLSPAGQQCGRHRLFFLLHLLQPQATRSRKYLSICSPKISKKSHATRSRISFLSVHQKICCLLLEDHCHQTCKPYLIPCHMLSLCPPVCLSVCQQKQFRTFPHLQFLHRYVNICL